MDNTFHTINDLISKLLKDLTDPNHKNEEYRSRLINTINDLEKLKAYY